MGEFKLGKNDSLQDIILEEAYNIKEVIEMIYEDKDRKFKTQGSTGLTYIAYKDGDIVWQGENQFDQKVQLGDVEGKNWVEVNTVKNLQEVIEMVYEGKDSTEFVLRTSTGDIYEGKLNNIMCVISGMYNPQKLAYILTNGKWSIR